MDKMNLASVLPYITLEANHQINGYLAPGFVRHNHTMELGIGLLQVYFFCNLAFVAGVYEVGHILGGSRPVVPLGNPSPMFYSA